MHLFFVVYFIHVIYLPTHGIRPWFPAAGDVNKPSIRSDIPFPPPFETVPPQADLTWSLGVTEQSIALRGLPRYVGDTSEPLH